MTINRWLLGAVVFIACAWAPSASAHRVGIPVTTIEWNAHADAWDIIHRLSAHDFSDDVDGLENADFKKPETQIILGEYIIEHFTMVGEAEGIEISFLGAEEEADSFYVYFQLVTEDQTVQIRNQLLAAGRGDDRRHALLNLNNGKATKTLFFTGNNTDQSLELVRPE